MKLVISPVLRTVNLEDEDSIVNAADSIWRIGCEFVRTDHRLVNLNRFRFNLRYFDNIDVCATELKDKFLACVGHLVLHCLAEGIEIA